MNVVLFGATGTLGTRIRQELLERGHQVTAVVRDPAKLETATGLTVKGGNVLEARDVAEAVQGADAVISAFGPPPDDPKQLAVAAEALTDGLQRAGVNRLIAVGGAGTLDIAPGVRFIDAPGFPEAYKPAARAHLEALEVVRKSPLDWTSIAPAAFIMPGQRTGNYRTGGDLLVTDSSGRSQISAEDFAIAVVDELENGRHIRQRFTVAY